jgi:predicted transcriptional regulator
MVECSVRQTATSPTKVGFKSIAWKDSEMRQSSMESKVGHSADVCAHLEVVSRAADSVKRTLALHRLSLISGYLDLVDQCCVGYLRERYYTQAVRLYFVMVDHTANDTQQHSADEDDAAYIAEETQNVWRRLAEYS